ncbi:MAG: cell envelope integrity protein CreD [Bacteroidia bacterium]|nr:cell envelope integrity protein CreD [Bacteroidia bacterium]
MAEGNLSFFDRLNNWASGSVMLKLLVIGILILVLLIPSSMVQSLIREREGLRDEAEREISSKWGGVQKVGGVVISVPYEVITKNDKGQTVTEIRYAHFLPDELNVAGDLQPQKRYRGIYLVMLYHSHLHFSGSFSKLNLDPLNINRVNFHFEDAFLSVGITDMRGINEQVKLKLNDSLLAFESGIPVNDLFSSGISVPVKMNPEETYRFSFDLDLNGSRYIRFYPLGKQTHVTLSSAWPSPSFDGSFLPDNRTISDSGFTADWKVLQLNRNYPQQGLGSFISLSQNNDEGDTYTTDNDKFSSFGVRLLLPVDEYQKNNRSAKYSVMFIFLTFLTLFFVEMLNKKRIHPIQYLLAGFAIVLFYVLLLSFSEHISFDKAYWTAGIAIVSLLSFYVWSMVRKRKITVVVTAVFVILYGFFYSLLQLEDYALLFGSLGLLLILGTVMYLTRNLNWNNISRE